MVDKHLGSLAWKNVRGLEFTDQEARDAADFSDAINNYHFQREDLLEFVGAHQLLVGHRLYLAETLGVDDLGPVLMGDDDDRIVAIAKMRCQEASRGERQILLPGE